MNERDFAAILAILDRVPLTDRTRNEIEWIIVRARADAQRKDASRERPRNSVLH